MKKLRWVYVPPLIHLVLCITAVSGYLMPRLQALGILFSFLDIIDIPVSAVYIVLAWRNEALAFIWLIAAGTAWWYLVSYLVENRITAYRTARQTQ